MKNKFLLLLKLPLYWIYRRLDFPILLPFNYTFSITFLCNSRCKTCNIWKFKRENELTFNEWKKIIKNLGKAPFWITISGGEPFLVKWLPELLYEIHKINQPAIINIPTNALVTSIPERLEQILQKVTCSTLVVNFSVDGIGKLHDEIRGVKGNWKRFISIYEKTKLLQKKYRNLVIGIHTVISKWNVKKFPEIAEYIVKKLQPDQYITELAEERNEMDNFNPSPTPEPDDYAKAIEFLINLTREQLKMHKIKGLSRITESFRIEYYKRVVKLLYTQKEQLKSYAGMATIQIAPDGTVWECAVYCSNMGNIRNYDYNLKKCLKDIPAKIVRKRVKENHPCPLANEGYANLLLNPRVWLPIFRHLVNF